MVKTFYNMPMLLSFAGVADRFYFLNVAWSTLLKRSLSVAYSVVVNYSLGPGLGSGSPYAEYLLLIRNRAYTH